eukprot:86559_1
MDADDKSPGDDHHQDKRRKLDNDESPSSSNQDEPGAATNKFDVSFSQDAYSKVIDHIECPICNIVFRGDPIFQCSAGHIICSECKQRLPSPKKCPQCRKSVGNIRNRSLESLVESLPVPCKNLEHGCQIFRLSSLLESHEKECSFMRFECPHLRFKRKDCQWTGAASDVITHLKDAHNWKERTSFGPEERCVKLNSSSGFSGDLLVDEEKTWGTCVPVNGHDFICVISMPKESKLLRLSVYHVDPKPFGRVRIRIELKNAHEVTHSVNIPSILDEIDPDLGITIPRKALIVRDTGSVWIHMSILTE